MHFCRNRSHASAKRRRIRPTSLRFTATVNLRHLSRTVCRVSGSLYTPSYNPGATVRPPNCSYSSSESQFHAVVECSLPSDKSASRRIGIKNVHSSTSSRTMDRLPCDERRTVCMHVGALSVHGNHNQIDPLPIPSLRFTPDQLTRFRFTHCSATILAGRKSGRPRETDRPAVHLTTADF